MKSVTMRTIKFRAKSLCKGEDWVYGDLVHYNRNPHTEKWTIHEPDTGIGTDIDETTIGQYTGLTDRYGKEIYEGDIIEAEGIRTNVRKIVKFEEDRGCWIACRTNGSSPDFDLCEFCGISEIRGNIHDNPELLK